MMLIRHHRWAFVDAALLLISASLVAFTCLTSLRQWPADQRSHSFLVQRSLDHSQFIVESQDDALLWKSRTLNDLYISKKVSSSFLKRVSAVDRRKCHNLVLTFLRQICSAVANDQLAGGACNWICDKSEESKRFFKLCPYSETHVTEDNLFMVTSAGPVFGLNEKYFDDIMSGYKMTITEELGSFHTVEAKYRQLLANTLNKYLNPGKHEQILNMMFKPSHDPIPLSQVQSLNDLFKDRRFVLSLLFYGTGERAYEPPGTDTESITAISSENYCGAVYQTTNLENNTTPLTSVFNQSAESSWTLGPTISSYYLHQVILHLLDLEEATSEHVYEGKFHLCHINSSQLLLHNICVKRAMTVYQKLDNQCTIKVLDISKMLFSEHEVSSLLNKQKCTHSHECRFYSCSGECVSNRCVATDHTQLAGVLQICHLIKTIEDQVLEGQNTTTRGHLFMLIDRCLDLKYYPLDSANATDQLILDYNIVFHELKNFFIDLLAVKRYELSRQAEQLTAKREARKQQAKAKIDKPT